MGILKNIEDKLLTMRRKGFIPRFLYVGYEEMKEIKKDGGGYSDYSGRSMFMGLDVIEVNRGEFLEVGP